MFCFVILCLFLFAVFVCLCVCLFVYLFVCVLLFSLLFIWPLAETPVWYSRDLLRTRGPRFLKTTYIYTAHDPAHWAHFIPFWESKQHIYIYIYGARSGALGVHGTGSVNRTKRKNHTPAQQSCRRTFGALGNITQEPVWVHRPARLPAHIVRRMGNLKYTLACAKLRLPAFFG